MKTSDFKWRKDREENDPPDQESRSWADIATDAAIEEYLMAKAERKEK
jgi:hypothetical protein